jgi:DNA-binding IclR family transcriptional regulator
MPDDMRGRGVQSVETSVAILRALAEAPGPLTLTDLSRRTGLAAAKLHRYLVSFVDTGMIDHRKSGAYDLGRGCAELGMAALARVDPINRAADALPQLVDATGVTAMLSVWGSEGPTVVRWERAARPLVTALGVGAVLPVLTSATGLAFLGWLPERVVLAALADADPVSLRSLRARIRADGCATADQTFIPGLWALAAPVLDLQGQAVAVVTLVSTDRTLLDEGAVARDALLGVCSVRRPCVPGARDEAGDALGGRAGHPGGTG